ncbi:MAG TPA: GNAT family N-acetyltransferase [Pyrinomonadaceae bacterium]|nr:GNAT family N-acetyltransferase [Pyrinomonadaceae bacterium]
MSEGEEIRVVTFDERFAADFARLNYRWIEEHFRIEPHDRELLDAPLEQIVEPGGEVFFALADGAVAGTVAMVRTDADTYELTKMAVDPEFQGRGIANHLMRACIDLATADGVNKVFLETHSKLPAAIALYRKFGFVETPRDPGSQYSRAEVRMELAIADGSM